jgi:hypothetical protein
LRYDRYIDKYIHYPNPARRPARGSTHAPESALRRPFARGAVWPECPRILPRGPFAPGAVRPRGRSPGGALRPVGRGAPGFFRRGLSPRGPFGPGAVRPEEPFARWAGSDARRAGSVRVEGRSPGGPFARGAGWNHGRAEAPRGVSPAGTMCAHPKKSPRKRTARGSSMPALPIEHCQHNTLAPASTETHLP